ncbi:MAG: rhomboid family intramembrane serine protease [Tabrizicola sp.]|uniref:rhomboid family intramembrane serine protease n=1 Tax=Tabrizicola sp. TaxID=2005166 RepID=UPI002732C3D5|nr:rhomboid family intramembrane serine protease [Tabrizicola sp.]MDP3264835.1 rhomboid family intramembrane serine protease [Tabrizicola sp.]MDP3647570.1 rhomboid family intramembrane serine protease [Paracoccaceae bacterium]MDZ4069200.1 rhomboid family intramembrane serine protease [Tabrizicola sp.]
MDQDHNAPPLNPLPVIVWIMVLPLVAMEVVLSLADRGIVGGPMAVGWRLQAVERFGFFPDLLRYMVETGAWSAEGVMRLVSFPLVHVSFTHALFAIVILLALGKMVGEIFRWWAVLAVVLGAAAAGAVAYTYLLPGVRAQLIGAYPAVYGLIGAFTFLIWVRLAGTGTSRYRAFSLIGMLLGVQLLFGVLFGTSWEWVADLAGFTTGFLLSFVVSPGGLGRVVAMIRQR